MALKTTIKTNEPAIFRHNNAKTLQFFIIIALHQILRKTKWDEMTKKHFSILYFFTTLAMLLCSSLCVNANPFFSSHAETVRLPKAKKPVLSKEVIQETKRNLVGELVSDDLYGHPDEYFVRLQRSLQHNVEPQQAIYSSLTDNLFDAAPDVSEHSFARQNTVPIQPYYYTFLFRLTPF